MDVLDDSGSLSTYIAAAVVLPLLAMLAGAGLALSGLATTASDVNDARDAGVVAAEVQGGLTPAVTDQVRAVLANFGLPASNATITGTPAPASWGSPIQVTVTMAVPLAGFPWNTLGLAGRSVTVGGTTYTTSNLAP